MRYSLFWRSETTLYCNTLLTLHCCTEQEDRINKSIERSKAPVQKKTGKPVMFRAPPLITRKRDKDVKEERNEDEEDLREFLTE